MMVFETQQKVSRTRESFELLAAEYIGDFMQPGTRHREIGGLWPWSAAQSSFPYPKVSGVFDLGQLLTELAFNQKFEDLFEDEDKEHGQLTRSTPLLAAQRLLDDVYIKLGPRYWDAVWRRITGRDIRETNIEDPNFRRQFHQDVVVPLRDTYRFFTGSKRSDFRTSRWLNGSFKSLV